MPGVDGAAHRAVPARAPGVRALPLATQRVPRVPHRVLQRAEPSHGRGGGDAAVPVPARVRARGAAPAARAARGQLCRAALPLPRARVPGRARTAARAPRAPLPE